MNQWADRGYINEEMLTSPHLASFHSIGICNDASRNPFLTQERVDDQKAKWKASKKMRMDDEENPDSGRTVFNDLLMEKCIAVFEEWIIDPTERLGTDVRVATEEVQTDNGKTIKITAFAVREKFDCKTASKDLFFFSTGGGMRSMSHVWVAVPGKAITTAHLFSDKKECPERIMVEAMLKEYCRPLTVDQRCADWFLLKWLLSGTNAGCSFVK